MKRIACIFLIAIAGCSTATDSTNLNGAYLMKQQHIKNNDVDTITVENRQLKIYAGNVMMYVLFNPSQDASAFAVGRYSFSSGKLAETILYNATENLQNNIPFSDTVQIEKNDSGYVQVTSRPMGAKGAVKVTETYLTAGTNATSLVDGVWKQVSSYALRGNDTIRHNDIEYKAFYSGYFSYGDYYTDTIQQNRTGISYGTFSMDSSHNLTETITASTWPELVGKTFVLGITVSGKDSFTQVTYNPTGDKEISVYERIK